MRTAGYVLLLVLFSAATLAAEEANQHDVGGGSLSVFDIPAIVESERALAALTQLGETVRAASLLDALIARYPSLGFLYYERARLEIQQSRHQEANQNLADAIAAGYPPEAIERDPAFEILRSDDAFQQLIKSKPPSSPPLQSRTITPALAGNGVALVSDVNTAFDPGIGMLRSFFQFPSNIRAPNSVAAGVIGAEELNEWFLQGTAAGNEGDLYDNRDGGHSSLPSDLFPQLTRITYSTVAQEAGLDRALDRWLVFNAPTIGNASLAITGGTLWRSLPRAALTDPQQVNSLYQEYAANHIYVYPAHEDYGRARGDLITANTPYMLISVGSSGTDQPLLKAVASILAAFRPEVKAFLTKNGLIAPTVQWIFRRGQFDIDDDNDYLSGRAHPSAFDGKRLNPVNMIERAHQLAASEVPPMVRLRVKEESGGQDGGGSASGEIFYDTPSAIGRVFRSTAYAKRLVVDAGGTADPNGRALTFRWAVLRGNKSRITVRPLNEAASLAEIIIPWDAGVQPTDGPNITGDRVEIGVFANNGKNWSAPAFISVLFPGNEKRLYRADKQIEEIDYNDPAHQQRYVDPVLFPLREWRDEYIYDKTGQLLGWQRLRADGQSRFTRQGEKVIENDALGRPLKAERIRYEPKPRADGRIEVVELSTGEFVGYSYAGDGDQVGIVTQIGGR